MRPPENFPSARRPPNRRRRLWIVIIAAVVIILLASVHSLAIFYTDALWFSSVHLGSVWRSLLAVKVGLFVSFGAAFFVVLWSSLVVADRIAARSPAGQVDDELVRHYRQIVGPYAVWLRAAVSLVVALIAAAGSIGQWNNWILFRNAVPFGVKDPEFHKDVSFFVFKLPFLQFIVGWSFVSLVVILVITLVAHYLNGGIRSQGPGPRVGPLVKAHLSVLLGLMALVKAFGYYLQRFELDLSTSGYVQGAGYTAVHARLPALTLLIGISVVAAAIFIYNIRRRGWIFPALGVGLWALVSLLVGTIYPLIVQQLKVNPAQGQLEAPYIADNITATRAAMQLNGVQKQSFSDTPDLTASNLASDEATLEAANLWDPTQTMNTYLKLQDVRSYYNFTTLATDRYDVNGVETPVVVGVRQINSSDLPAASWVNTHLQYTHGYGMVISPSNISDNNGNPLFPVGSVPPTTGEGLPAITQPSVYFGLQEPGYVVADSAQPEIDYQSASGTPVETHYSGSGGVKLSSIFRRAAFAVRYNDLNLLISDQITSSSKILFVRDVQGEISKAAPFLSLDSDPYPVVVDGQIDWIQDAYTTTDDYPYAQNVDTSQLNPSVSGTSGLVNQNENYVRNSVKVVVNAYTGQMTFYVSDPSDPIIRTYERAFPSMFTPMSKMPQALVAHIRYPEDLFTLQAEMLGRYHITNAQAFYDAGDQWAISPTPGNGSPTASDVTTTTNDLGEVVQGPVPRMAPVYQVLQLPGTQGEQFTLSDAFVPYSAGSQIQNLAGFLIAGNDPGDYGKLTMYITPRGQSFAGPAQVDAHIAANATVSKAITLLNQGGSSVTQGNVLMLPLGNSLLYIRPLYVQSQRNPYPQLTDVVVDYNGAVSMDSSLGAALADAFTGFTLPSPGGAVAPVTPTTPTAPVTQGSSSAAQTELNDASAAWQQGQTDLKAGNLGAYQSDMNHMNADLQQAQKDLAGSSSTSTGTATSTTSTSTTSTTAAATTSATSGPA